MIVSLAWDTKMHIKYLCHQSKGSFWKALKFIFIFGFFIRVICDIDIHNTWKMSYFHIVYDFKKQTIEWNRTFSKKMCNGLGNTFKIISIIIVLSKLQIKPILGFCTNHWAKPSLGQLQQIPICVWRKRNWEILFVRLETAVDTLETI